MTAVNNEIKRSNTVKLALANFRKDMEMSNAEYLRFCKRYASRPVSTVVGEFSKRYGPMPRNAADMLHMELQNELKRFEALEQYRSNR